MQQHSPQVYAWQHDVWQHLQQRYPKLGHALLFYGKHGCGKHAFVQHFIAWLLCLNRQHDTACGECQSCIWLQSDIHPHLMYIQPDEEQSKETSKEKGKKAKATPRIKIEKVREILPFVQQTLEGWRVIVIDPAEALNIAASNALLKTLEEPSERVIIILLAEHYLKLPATIRSRMQHFALDRISTEQAQQYLHQLLQQQNLHISDEQQHILLNLAENMPHYAAELAQSEWVNFRAEWLNDWLHLYQSKSMPLDYANKWQKLLNFQEFNTLFESVLSDVIRIKLQQPYIHQDLAQLPRLAEQVNLSYLFALYEKIQQSKLLLQQNVQSNLILDQYFIELMNVQG